MNIVLIGPQGSGKGTQGVLLATKLGIPHISTGTILRELAKKDDEEGKKIREIMNQGLLVEDAFLEKVLLERLSKPDCKKGFILDGTPRDIKQAEMLERITHIDVAILINISEEESVRRVTKRQFIEHRADDNLVSLKKRLKAYHDLTLPVVDYYRKKGILIEINGEQSRDKVFEDIINSLSKPSFKTDSSITSRTKN